MQELQLQDMTSDNSRLRGEFLNTQVITRNTGIRLGVVKELLVDVDQREVVALGLRDNVLSLSGIPKYMYLNSITKSGDVVLVENEDVIEDVDIDAYSKLINSEVITETGEPLGRVRDFVFNLEDGKVHSLIIASIGLPQIPEQLISTYELPVEEIVSSGPHRVIVFEGAEDRLKQISEGILERLGIGRPIWEREREEEMDSLATVKPENQLPTGIPVRSEVQKRVELKTPVREERWDEDEWEETNAAPAPRQKVRYQEYDEDEEDNWGEAKREGASRYDANSGDYDDYEYADRNVDEDVWDDDVGPETYKAPPIEIPKKKKAPQYEEEPR